MSDLTLSSLEYITREDLSSHILSPTTTANTNTPTAITTSSSSSPPSLPPHVAVVDVRDSDHVGGHIRGSTWVPSSELDYKTAELVRTLRDKEVVVFHCALSQQRGPSAALRYLREKQRLEPGSQTESQTEGKGEGEEKEKEKEKEGQKVYVLQGGFTKWQEKYGEDTRLTEGYQKDIWEFGY